MRALIIKPILLILIIHSSCSTRKLNKQKLDNSTSVQSEIRKQEDHHIRYDGKRIILMTDSADEIYTIRIIPVDTFTFSAQNGFRGKAEKIEISGLRSRVKTLSDSAGIRAEQKSSRIDEEHQQSRTHESAKSKVLEKESMMVMGILTGLVLTILLGYYLRKWIRNRPR